LAGNTTRLWLGAKQLLARFLCYVLARGISKDALSWRLGWAQGCWLVTKGGQSGIPLLWAPGARSRGSRERLKARESRGRAEMEGARGRGEPRPPLECDHRGRAARAEHGLRVTMTGSDWPLAGSGARAGVTAGTTGQRGVGECVCVCRLGHGHRPDQS
jgi:hypothetical protein